MEEPCPPVVDCRTVADYYCGDCLMGDACVCTEGSPAALGHVGNGYALPTVLGEGVHKQGLPFMNT